MDDKASRTLEKVIVLTNSPRGSEQRLFMRNRDRSSPPMLCNELVHLSGQMMCIYYYLINTNLIQQIDPTSEYWNPADRH
jgi:hypothetical protein